MAKGQKKFAVATLGCRTNQSESEGYVRQLEALGYVKAGEGEEADLCIVNSCTVTASADRHSRREIRRLSRRHPGSRLVVTGCLAERLPEAIGALPGVTDVIRNRDKEQLVEHLFPGEELPEFAPFITSDHARPFIKIQDGCNSFCTYCIIPYVRGRSRSRPEEEIVREVEGLVEQGFREVVLTGINIGDFTAGEGRRLAHLVRRIDGVPGLKRLRISSIDPDEVDDELASVVLGGRTTCPSMHIVLQSGSNVVLKRMNRKYTRQVFLQTVRRLQEASPEFTVTTDVIVGFPGETDADFQETLEVMNEVKFAKVHMFPYSDRERTRSALYPNKVSPHILQERKQRALRAAEEGAFRLRSPYVGRTVEVLVETEAPGFGHTPNFLPVTFRGRGKRGEIVSVLCTANTPLGLEGKVVP